MFGNFSLFKTPFPERSSVPPSFVSCFVFYIFSYLLSKTMGCFSGCLMSSAGIQKLFCGIYSAFKCSFDEFVGEKVFSPSYSSTIFRGSPTIMSLLGYVWSQLWHVRSSFRPVGPFLVHTGSLVVVGGLSCSVACGILPGHPTRESPPF